MKTNGYTILNHVSIFTKEGFFVREMANKLANLITKGTPLEPIANRSLDIRTFYNISNEIILIEQRKILGDFVLGSDKLFPISTITDKIFEKLKITQSKCPSFESDLSSSLLSEITKVNKIIAWRCEDTISPVITDLIKSKIAKDSHRADKIL